MTAKTAKAVIRSMYNYCSSKGLLSSESSAVMRDYFTRTARLTGGKKKRSAKGKI